MADHGGAESWIGTVVTTVMGIGAGAYAWVFRSHIKTQTRLARLEMRTARIPMIEKKVDEIAEHTAFMRGRWRERRADDDEAETGDEETE